jgi:hypothetical protein
MTTEVRTTIEPKDIMAVEIECAQCGFRTVRTITSWLGDSMRCGNCEKSWDEHKSMLKNIRDAVSLLRIVSLETKETMPFRVRLEIGSPNVVAKIPEGAK